MLRITNPNKHTIECVENAIIKLNNIDTINIYLNINKSQLEYFFNLLFYANNEELIKNPQGYAISQMLINFKCSKIFTKLSENNINKMFYYLEENKTELDKIQISKFRSIKMFIKMFKDQYLNNTSFDFEDVDIYKPRKGIKFYDNWINKQGEKLKRRLLSLNDHYN